MTTLLLIRHAQTDALGKVLAGWQAGWHLNHQGKLQASRLARSLAVPPIHAIYTSPLERAVETAEPVASRHNLSPQIRNGLGELRLGAWEGKTFEELSRSEEWMRYNNWRSGVRPPEGESMLETQTRIVNELQCLALQHSSQRVAVVSHADPIRAALAHYLGIPLDLTVRFEISPASVSVVEVGSEPPHVLCVNGAGDLAL